MGDDGGGGVFDANAELVNILDDILGSASEEDWIGEDSGSDEDDEEADAEAKEKTEGEAEYMYERVADSSESDDIDARLKVLFELENGGSEANSKLKTGKTEGSFSSEFSMASDISACYDITAEVIEDIEDDSFFL